MAIQINGNGTITGISVGGLPDGIVDTDMLAAGAATGTKLGSGAIVQTVIGANGENSGSSVAISSSDVDNPTFLDTTCKVTITPLFSNSKILLVWRAGIRLDPGSYGFFGVYYSPNSDMSSPVVLDKARGAHFNETYRNNDSGGSSHIFLPDTGVTWDATVTNTNTRYYNVGAYESTGTLIYGDQQIALQLMAQEIKA
jgi:hypothetical protein